MRIGIIGCGKQAEKHLYGLKKIPGIDIVVADVSDEASRALAEAANVARAKEPGDIFKDQSVRAVVICTPTRSHVSLIKQAVGAGKDVFCEKPLSDSLDEVLELQEMLVGQGSVVMIGYIYRFVPVFEEAWKLFRDGAEGENGSVMGRPVSAFFRVGGRGSHQKWKHFRDTGGGAINEMLVHMVDLANWYFGPLGELQVLSHSLLAPQRHIQGELVNADAEDYVLLRCKGTDGVEIVCQADLITPAFSQYVEIQAENGSFMGSIQGDMPNYVYLKEGRGGYRSGRTEIKAGARNLIDAQMQAFVDAVLKTGKQDRNRVTESVELMQVVEKIRAQVGGI